MHRSFLIYGGFVFLKWAAFLGIAAIIAYGWHQPWGQPNGGTWLGYTLGTIGALLILWLMWYGIRKRRYGAGSLNLQGWLSGHVYLGVTLVVIATLHSGFQFGWNVHTLAYGLMLLVVLSGLWGAIYYVFLPQKVTQNRDGRTLDDMVLQIADIDQQCRSLCFGRRDEIVGPVIRACDDTTIGGSVWRQLSGRHPRCATAGALDHLHRLGADLTGSEAEDVTKLAGLLSKKNEILLQARQDIRYHALLKVWLFLHLPLSFALLIALTVHVFAVFFYW